MQPNERLLKNLGVFVYPRPPARNESVAVSQQQKMTGLDEAMEGLGLCKGRAAQHEVGAAARTWDPTPGQSNCCKSQKAGATKTKEPRFYHAHCGAAPSHPPCVRARGPARAAPLTISWSPLRSNHSNEKEFCSVVVVRGVHATLPFGYLLPASAY